MTDIEGHNERMNQLALEIWRRNLKPDPGGPVPNVNEMIQSKYLSKADVPVPVICTIRDVSLERFNNAGRPGDRDSAWLLWLAELPKALKLNNTNIRILEAGLGAASEAWTGKRIEIYVDASIMMSGQVVGGLRLRIPQPAPINLTTPPLPPGARFDPLTGAPLAQPPMPAARFDPMTGKPLQAAAAAAAAALDAEFSDDIPF